MNSRIGKEWLRLVDLRLPDGRLPPEVEPAWARLWDDHIEGERLARTDLDDAVLICQLGWTLAMQQEDRPAAARRLRRWFDHPDAGRTDSATCYTRAQFRCWIAFALLLDLQEAEALPMYHALLNERPPEYHHTAALLRNDLHDYSRAQPAEAIAPAPFARMVLEVLEHFPRSKRTCKRLARTIEPGVATFGRLGTILEHTYPR